MPRPQDLTTREIEIGTLVIEGLTNDEIAVRLVVSPRTVQSHVASAMSKVKARNRTQLAVFLLRAGFVALHADSPAES